MTNYEQTLQVGPRGKVVDPRKLHVARKPVTRSKVVMISSTLNAAETVSAQPRKRVLGRKGRRAAVRRRALDGAFLTFAMATAALVWWSSR